MQKKTLEMRNERVRKIIEKETEGKYSVFFRKSNDTNSYYYTISKGEARITLRFSDHKANSGIKSFSLTKRVKPEAVHRYVRRRLKDLEVINVNTLINQFCY